MVITSYVRNSSFPLIFYILSISNFCLEKSKFKMQKDVKGQTLRDDFLGKSQVWIITDNIRNVLF